MTKDLLTIVLIVAPWIMYFIEHQKRMKAEQDLAIVIKRKGLNEISKNVDDSRADLDATIRELGSEPIPTNEDDMSPRPVQSPAPEGDTPKGFIKAIAGEDIREGQLVYTEIDTTNGTARVYPARAEPVFVAAKEPPGES